VERLAVLALLNADELLVLGDHRVVLTGFGSQEAPVVVKAPGVGPVVERTGRALLLLGRQMPLADRRRRVAVLVEDLRKRRRVSRQHRRIAREAAGELRDASHATVAVAVSGAWPFGALDDGPPTRAEPRCSRPSASWLANARASSRYVSWRFVGGIFTPR